MAQSPVYRRILLKLSGEALMGAAASGYDPDTLRRYAEEIAGIHALGVQVGLVVGGGNLVRGAGLSKAGIDRVAADQMGMLATVMNALAMASALEALGVPARVLSALPVGQVTEAYAPLAARRLLEGNMVVLMAAGTGNPFFTTDTAASLRAIEVGADVMIKATKVDGVYSADPKRDPKAQFFSELSYDETLARGLEVMDATAVILCRDHGMPLRVMNVTQPGALRRLVLGEEIGTRVVRSTKA